MTDSGLRIVVGKGPLPYLVSDDNGSIYGRYENRAEAKQALKDWADYYGYDTGGDSEISE